MTTAAKDASSNLSQIRSRFSNAAYIVQITVGLVLLAAVVANAHELMTRPLNQAGGFWSSRWSRFGLIEVELALALLLLSGWHQRLSWFFAIATFAIFSGITAYRSWLGDESCGCFGVVKVDPRLTLALDIGLLVLLLIFRPKKSPAKPSFASGRFVVLLGAWLIAGLASAAAIYLKKPMPMSLDEDTLLDEGDYIVFDPQKWIGKPFPLARYSSVGDQLKTSRWIVVLYKSDCEHCQFAMPRYQVFAKYVREPRMAMLELPPLPLVAQLPPSSSGFILFGTATPPREWLGELPIELLLQDGVVVHAQDRGRGLDWYESWKRDHGASR